MSSWCPAVLIADAGPHEYGIRRRGLSKYPAHRQKIGNACMLNIAVGHAFTPSMLIRLTHTVALASIMGLSGQSSPTPMEG